MTTPALNSDALTDALHTKLGIPTTAASQPSWRLDSGTVEWANSRRAEGVASDPTLAVPGETVDITKLDDHGAAQLTAAREAGLPDHAARWVQGTTPAELAADAHTLAASRQH